MSLEYNFSPSYKIITDYNSFIYIFWNEKTTPFSSSLRKEKQWQSFWTLRVTIYIVIFLSQRSKLETNMWRKAVRKIKFVFRLEHYAKLFTINCLNGWSTDAIEHCPHNRRNHSLLEFWTLLGLKYLRYNVFICTINMYVAWKDFLTSWNYEIEKFKCGPYPWDAKILTYSFWTPLGCKNPTLSLRNQDVKTVIFKPSEVERYYVVLLRNVF